MQMDFIPGFAQGLVRVLISYPFDYVRTHLQANPNITWRSIPLGRSLYRGISIPLIIVPFDRALQYGIYERCQRKKYSQVSSSLIATFLSSIYSVPANFLQTQIMMNSMRPTKSHIALKFSNLSFRGYGADTLRAFASSFIYLTAYGTLRNKIPKEYHNYFVFGIISSTLMWSTVYPLDTLRILRQTTNPDSQHISYWSFIKMNWKSGSLYRGLPIVIMRSIPSAGCGMLTYEYVRYNLSISQLS